MWELAEGEREEEGTAALDEEEGADLSRLLLRVGRDEEEEEEDPKRALRLASASRL